MSEVLQVELPCINWFSYKIIMMMIISIINHQNHQQTKGTKI